MEPTYKDFLQITGQVERLAVRMRAASARPDWADAAPALARSLAVVAERTAELAEQTEELGLERWDVTQKGEQLATAAVPS